MTAGVPKKVTKTPFTLEPNGTDPKLVRTGLAFTLESLKPFHLEPLSVLFWLRWRNGSIWFQRKRAEPNGTEPRENGYENEKWFLYLLYYFTRHAEESWIFVIEYTSYCNYFRNHLQPFRVSTWGMELFGSKWNRSKQNRLIFSSVNMVLESFICFMSCGLKCIHSAKVFEFELVRVFISGLTWFSHKNSHRCQFSFPKLWFWIWQLDVELSLQNCKIFYTICQN